MKRTLFLVLMISTFLCYAQAAWTSRASLGPGGRELPSAFSVNGKGYIGLGIVNSNLMNDLWEYDPAANMWTQRANFTGPERRVTTGFSTCGAGYVGAGWDGSSYFNDFYMYYPATNTWSSVTSLPAQGRYGAVSMNISGEVYFGMGTTSGGPQNDFYHFEHCAFSSVEENAEQNGLLNLKAFPSPSLGDFSVDLRALPSVALEMRMYNRNGAVVWKESQTGGQNCIIRPILPAGEYLITVNAGSDCLGVGRVIIVR